MSGKWEKGVSGNPNGRPKVKDSWTDLLRQMGDQVDQDGRTRKEIVMEQVFKRACDGDMRACELLLDRVEGRAVQAIKQDLTSSDGSMSANVKFKPTIIPIPETPKNQSQSG